MMQKIILEIIRNILSSVKIHKTADVQSQIIGANTSIWQFVVILEKATIGKNCNICSHVFIENDVIIGDNVTIKAGVQLWDGITIDKNVFIGPNVTFTNDLIPRSKVFPEKFAKTTIEEGASIGANATILAGNKIGKYSMIGAGTVVTKNVGPFELWIGNPGKHVGYVTKNAEILKLDLVSKKNKTKYEFRNNELIKIL